MTLRTYILGFASSLLLTLIAFGLIEWHILSQHEYPPHSVLIPVFVLLALIQLVVQLVFFLHVGKEHGPRWNLTALSFALIVVCILVGGTLWIMHNLSHGQMDSMSKVFINGEITPQNEND